MIKISNYIITVATDIYKKLNGERKTKIKEIFNEFECKFYEDSVLLTRDSLLIEVKPRSIKIVNDDYNCIPDYLRDILKIFNYNVEDNQLYVECKINMDVLKNGKKITNATEQAKIIDKIINPRPELKLISYSYEFFMIINSNLLQQVSFKMNPLGLLLSTTNRCKGASNICATMQKTNGFIENELIMKLEPIISEED